MTMLSSVYVVVDVVSTLVGRHVTTSLSKMTMLSSVYVVVDVVSTLVGRHVSTVWFMADHTSGGWKGGIRRGRHCAGGCIWRGKNMEF